LLGPYTATVHNHEFDGGDAVNLNGDVMGGDANHVPSLAASCLNKNKKTATQRLNISIGW
jgi:hypothetical protein